MSQNDRQGSHILVRLEDRLFGLPTLAVREMLACPRVTTVPRLPDHVRGLVNLRGEVLPLVDLAALLGRPRGDGAIGIVIQAAHQSVILMVDSFVGQDEVVIKALDAYKPKGVAGATLANDGTLVLVLDLAEILPPNALKAAA